MTMADLSADIEQVTNWAASKKLSVDTVKMLFAYGCKSMDALETLTPLDISKAKIPMGQMNAGEEEDDKAEGGQIKVSHRTPSPIKEVVLEVEDLVKAVTSIHEIL